MSKTINLDEEVYKEISSYGNRDESYNTILSRILNHIDEEEAQRDRMNRKTTFETSAEDKPHSATNSAVEKLEEGTVVRFRIERGKYAGEEKTGKVRRGQIEYNGNLWTPTGMAREADQDIRGPDARDSGSYSGPREVEYRDESGEWVPIHNVLE